MSVVTRAEQFKASIQDSTQYYGCDGGDPGSPESPSIWLFGIEPGWSKKDAAQDAVPQSAADQERFARYAVDLQLEWPFNRNAFKLLAALEGHSPDAYRSFALERRPFEAGSRGYFKGNLSPIPFNNVDEWDGDAQEQTGFADRLAYETWLQSARLPVIAAWVAKARPRLFIGTGSSRATLFGAAVQAKGLSTHEFKVGDHVKRIHWSTDGLVNLLVIPHLSGGPNGLNSDESILAVSEFARENGLLK